MIKNAETRQGIAGELSQDGVKYGGGAPQVEFMTNMKEENPNTGKKNWEEFMKRTGNVIQLESEAI